MAKKKLPTGISYHPHLPNPYRSRINSSFFKGSEYHQTQAEAEDWLADKRKLIRRMKNGGRIRPEDNPQGIPTLEEFFQIYLDLGCNNTPDGLHEKKRHLKHLRNHMGAMRLDAVADALEIARYAKARQLEPSERFPKQFNSPRTVNAELTTLSHLLTVARKWNKISQRPTIEKVPEVSINPNENIPYDEMMQILGRAQSHGTPEEAVAIALGFYAGLRRGEVYRFKWSDMEWDAMRLRVESSVEHGRNKSNRTERIDLDEDLIPYLQAAKKNRQFVSPYVVPGRFGKQRYLGSKFKPLIRIIGELGFEGRGYHFHSLRHALATHMAESGCNASEIQRMLRHRNITTSQRYIDNVSSDRVRTTLRAAREAKRTHNA